MITPDDNITCRIRHNLGLAALYDVCNDSELSEGVVLCAAIQGVNYLFQLDCVTNILMEDNVYIMLGTLCEYLEDAPCDKEIDYFPILNCRFPTKEELEWYEKQHGV